MERIVNSSDDQANPSPYILSLPPASSSSSTTSFNHPSSSSTRVMSMTDVTTATTNYSQLKSSTSSTGTGDVKDSLKLLDDTLNFYEDSSPTDEMDIDKHFEEFSSSQGETTEDDEPRNIANQRLGQTETSRVTLVPLPRVHRNTLGSTFTYGDTNYNSNRSISSVEASRTRLDERIEARIRRNRVRPPLRASIFLDSTNSESNILPRR